MPVATAIPWTDQHAVEFIDLEHEMRHATHAARAMAERYGCSWRSVYVMLQRMGISHRSERRGVPGLVIRMRLILAQCPPEENAHIIGKMMLDSRDSRLTRITTFRLLCCVLDGSEFAWPDGEAVAP
jgi:hypothetical protein